MRAQSIIELENVPLKVVNLISLAVIEICALNIVFLINRVASKITDVSIQEKHKAIELPYLVKNITQAHIWV